MFQKLGKSLWFFVGVLMLLGSCAKEEKKEVYEDLILKGNPVPSYSGVTGLQIKNYINKTKIDLLGEQPTEAEFSQWMDFLIEEELSDSSRAVMAANFMGDMRYYDRFFEWNSANMLEAINYAIIDTQISELEYVIYLQYANGDTLEAQLLEKENIKLQLLRDAAAELRNENIDVSEFYTRMVNNDFYDEINMGTENFVIATFENLAGRLPTQYELQNGKAMVDGDLAILFLENGNTKDDFMEIFMHSEAFYQGIVQLQFDFLLARNANASELETLLPILKDQGDIRPVQTFILSTDEYAGFE
ncbi:MAG: hypothetical protein WD048_01050 [Chitinophagales bacterium]